MTIAELTEELEQTADYYLSEECEAFERLLEGDVNAILSLRDAEARWNEACRSGTLPFNFEFDRRITDRYRAWVKGARIRFKQLQLQEEKGCCPASADLFRNALDEAEETLVERTQDEGGALAGLQDVE